MSNEVGKGVTFAVLKFLILFSLGSQIKCWSSDLEITKQLSE